MGTFDRVQDVESSEEVTLTILKHFRKSSHTNGRACSAREQVYALGCNKSVVHQIQVDGLGDNVTSTPVYTAASSVFDSTTYGAFLVEAFDEVVVIGRDNSDEVLLRHRNVDRVSVVALYFKVTVFELQLHETHITFRLNYRGINDPNGMVLPRPRILDVHALRVLRSRLQHTERSTLLFRCFFRAPYSHRR